MTNATKRETLTRKVRFRIHFPLKRKTQNKEAVRSTVRTIQEDVCSKGAPFDVQRVYVAKNGCQRWACTTQQREGENTTTTTVTNLFKLILNVQTRSETKTGPRHRQRQQRQNDNNDNDKMTMQEIGSIVEQSRRTEQTCRYTFCCAVQPLPSRPMGTLYSYYNPSDPCRQRHGHKKKKKKKKTEKHDSEREKKGAECKITTP